MVITTLNGYLILQNPGATTRPAQPASQGGNRSLGEQIRAETRAQVAAARSQAAAAAATAQGSPAPPAAPDAPRTFTIRGPNGEQTTIGMPPASDIIPPQAVDISVAFFITMAIIIIGLPLARAFARRMDRKVATPQISNDVSAQLAHLSQAVDAIALEVERITEGQRFTTKLLSEQRDAARQTLPSANR